VSKIGIYIPSYSRPNSCLTAQLLQEYGVDFKICVREEQLNAYSQQFSVDRLVSIPNSAILSDWALPSTRTFIKKYSESQGEDWHWQIDDDIKSFRIKEVIKRKYVKCSPELVFDTCKKFIDKYSNIELAGISHGAFANFSSVPFKLNKQCSTVVCIKNNNGLYWREKTIEDTDYSLQVLSTGKCTVEFCAFCFDAPASCSQEGGCTDNYNKQDKQISQIRAMQRYWRALEIKVNRKNGSPRIVTSSIWKKFNQRLEKK